MTALETTTKSEFARRIIDASKKGLGHLVAAVIAIPIGLANWDYFVGTQSRHLRYYRSSIARDFNDPIFVNAQIDSITRDLERSKGPFGYISDAYNDFRPKSDINRATEPA